MNVFRKQAARRRVVLLLLATALLVGPAGRAAEVPSQLQVARRFLLAILQGHYRDAYQMLAPEVRTGVTPQRFQQAAEPLYRQGKKFGGRIELYKLGVRLGENEAPRLFYAFTFKGDTLGPAPQQLDVTFRDTLSRGVLEFRLLPRPRAATKPAAK